MHTSWSFIIIKMKMKTAVRYYHTSIRLAKIWKPDIIKSCQGCGLRDFHLLLVGTESGTTNHQGTTVLLAAGRGRRL
jgi:UTP:GlnB (protein PII) uridylyltransferase